MCAGAIIYLEKAHRRTVGMRRGVSHSLYDPARLAASHDCIIDLRDAGRLPRAAYLVLVVDLFVSVTATQNTVPVHSSSTYHARS
jgi:hypothetical protein